MEGKVLGGQKYREKLKNLSHLFSNNVWIKYEFLMCQNLKKPKHRLRNWILNWFFCIHLYNNTYRISVKFRSISNKSRFFYFFTKMRKITINALSGIELKCSWVAVVNFSRKDWTIVNFYRRQKRIFHVCFWKKKKNTKAILIYD